MEVKCKRVYSAADDSDGYRVLVDRLWPRGIKKEAAYVDLWAKQLAPSNELRKWFGHIPERFPEFREKYIAEIKSNAGAKEIIDQLRKRDVVTLLYSAKDEEHNNAVVLKDFLQV